MNYTATVNQSKTLLKLHPEHLPKHTPAPIQTFSSWTRQPHLFRRGQIYVLLVSPTGIHIAKIDFMRNSDKQNCFQHLTDMKPFKDRATIIDYVRKVKQTFSIHRQFALNQDGQSHKDRPQAFDSCSIYVSTYK